MKCSRKVAEFKVVINLVSNKCLSILRWYLYLKIRVMNFLFGNKSKKADIVEK